MPANALPCSRDQRQGTAEELRRITTLLSTPASNGPASSNAVPPMISAATSTALEPASTLLAAAQQHADQEEEKTCRHQRCNANAKVVNYLAQNSDNPAGSLAKGRTRSKTGG
jgi:hypothetical protein